MTFFKWINSERGFLFLTDKIYLHPWIQNFYILLEILFWQVRDEYVQMGKIIRIQISSFKEENKKEKATRSLPLVYFYYKFILNCLHLFFSFYISQGSILHDSTCYSEIKLFIRRRPPCGMNFLLKICLCVCLFDGCTASWHTFDIDYKE